MPHSSRLNSERIRELFQAVEHAYPTAQIPASTSYLIAEVWDDYIAAHPELARP